MNTIAFIIYLGAVIVSVTCYIFFVLRICKSDNISLKEAFGFAKGNKADKSVREVKQQREPQQEHKLAPKRNSKSSIQAEINTLNDLVIEVDDGNERIKIMNKIKELQEQL